MREIKDSGIEWFPQIPANWATARLKDVISVLTDYTANGSFADLAKNVEYHDYDDYARLVRLTDLRDNLENPGVYVDKESYEYLGKSKLFGNEILVANVGAYAGLFCEMPPIDMPATLGPNMFLIRTNQRILDDKFLCDWIRAVKHLPDVVKIYPLMPTMKLPQRVDVLKSLV